MLDVTLPTRVFCAMVIALVAPVSVATRADHRVRRSFEMQGRRLLPSVQPSPKPSVAAAHCGLRGALKSKGRHHQSLEAFV